MRKNLFFKKKQKRYREEQREGAIRLFEAMSGIEESFLENSEKSVKTTKFHYYSKLLVASFCLAIMGGYIWTVLNNGGFEKTVGDEKSLLEDSVQEFAMEIIDFEENLQQLPLEEIPWSKENNTGTGRLINEGESLSAAGQLDSEQETYHFSVLEENANKEELFSDTISEKAEAEKEVYTSAQISDSQDISILDNTTMILSEEEAYQLEKLGNYVPEVLPAGYTFENAFCTEGEVTGQDCLSVTWTKGMDYIHITIFPKEEKEELYLVKKEEQEKYDVRLYTIPYAESVPEEYQQIFDNPVFFNEEFDEKIVQARLIQIQDKGDTQTPRGNFSVLYKPEEIVVEFNGRGEPTAVFEMFQSIPKK